MQSQPVASTGREAIGIQGNSYRYAACQHKARPDRSARCTRRLANGRACGSRRASCNARGHERGRLEYTIGATRAPSDTSVQHTDLYFYNAEGKKFRFKADVMRHFGLLECSALPSGWLSANAVLMLTCARQLVCVLAQMCNEDSGWRVLRRIKC